MSVWLIIGICILAVVLLAAFGSLGSVPDHDGPKDRDDTKYSEGVNPHNLP